MRSKPCQHYNRHHVFGVHEELQASTLAQRPRPLRNIKVATAEYLHLRRMVLHSRSESNYVKSRLLRVPLPNNVIVGDFISEAEDQEEVEAAVNCGGPLDMGLIPDSISATFSCVIRSYIYPRHDNDCSHSVNTLHITGSVHEQRKARRRRSLITTVYIIFNLSV
jgi:hypothetical protein